MSSYYTLIVSLPKLPWQFKVKQTPLSRIQLEKRLNLLTETEQIILKNLIWVIWDSLFSPKISFAETKNNAKKLLELHHPFITEIIHWFFDLRSIVVALRLRKTHESAPMNAQDYWFSRWNSQLSNHWNEIDFGLRQAYPYLPDLAEKIANNETAAVEEILLKQFWEHLRIIEASHYFDFEAVIIYVLRWNIVNYWSQFDDKLAIERINKLVDHLFRRQNSREM